MKKKTKRAIIISAAAVLVILLFPFAYHLKDGGTVIIEPICHAYKIEKCHSIYSGWESEDGDFLVGTIVYIFGLRVFDDSHIVYEER